MLLFTFVPQVLAEMATSSFMRSTSWITCKSSCSVETCPLPVGARAKPHGVCKVPRIGLSLKETSAVSPSTIEHCIAHDGRSPMLHDELRSQCQTRGRFKPNCKGSRTGLYRSHDGNDEVPGCCQCAGIGLSMLHIALVPALSRIYLYVSCLMNVIAESCCNNHHGPSKDCPISTIGKQS